MSEPRTPPKVLRRRAERHDRILACAARAFAERGPEAVSLDELAELAGVAKGTLYTHFPTKEALLVAIIEPALRATERRLDALTARTADAIVRELLQQWVELWQRHPEALRLGHSPQAAALGELRPLHRRVAGKLSAHLVRAARSGRLRGSAEWAAMALARLGVPLLESFMPLDPSGAAFVEAVSALLLRPTSHTEPKPSAKKPAAPRRAQR